VKKPRIGSLVHYHPYPGSEPRAAIVTYIGEVYTIRKEAPELVPFLNLSVFCDAQTLNQALIDRRCGVFYRTGDESDTQGYWLWPPPEEDE